MKQTLKIYLWILFFNIYNISFAADTADWGIFWKNMWDKLKEWDTITLNDIPNMIKSAIEFFISIAWTIAVIFVIIWAYKILFGSLQQDKTKWKDTIIMALWGFVIATLAWFIVQFIFDNFG
jgi:RsiW-degrading membrane proteinase PrsW (M82 family)